MTYQYENLMFHLVAILKVPQIPRRMAYHALCLIPMPGMDTFGGNLVKSYTSDVQRDLVHYIIYYHAKNALLKWSREDVKQSDVGLGAIPIGDEHRKNLHKFLLSC